MYAYIIWYKCYNFSFYNTIYFFFWREGGSSNNPAQGEAEGSVRVLLKTNPVYSVASCLVAVSRLNVPMTLADSPIGLPIVDKLNAPSTRARPFSQFESPRNGGRAIPDALTQ